jgi:hypothetical protein
MNGTCYTAEECSDRDGVATGSCADGFGVCCVISLSCGDTTSENCTYLTATTVVAGSSCVYHICPASSTVSRIRLDLTMFNIAGPFAAGTDGNAADSLLASGAIGQCTMDTFQVTGSGGASPVICGANDGQHVIVDTDGTTCVTAAFSFGLDTATRNYRIHAIQYDRLNEMGGPAGCLQFFTGMEGIVTTFNWQAVATSTHLANQDYKVCVRRMKDMCTICWTPTTAGNNAVVAPAEAVMRGSFGLSNGGVAADGVSMGGAGASCAADAAAANEDSNDFIIIPNGQVAVIQTPGAAAVVAGVDKYCGRYLSADAGVADAIVCSRVTPFTLDVFTDGFEADADAAADAAVAMAAKNEASAGAAGEPTGTMGFSLGFTQVAC